jgi:hypothetical protein
LHFRKGAALPSPIDDRQAGLMSARLIGRWKSARSSMKFGGRFAPILAGLLAEAPHRLYRVATSAQRTLPALARKIAAYVNPAR